MPPPVPTTPDRPTTVPQPPPAFIATIRDTPVDAERSLRNVLSRPDWFLAYCGALVAAFLALPLLATLFPGGSTVAAAVAVAIALAGGPALARWNHRRRMASLRYNLRDPLTRERWAGVRAAGRALAGSAMLWEEAHESVRIPVGCSRRTPGVVRVNVETWTLRLGTGSVLLLPDCLLVVGPERVTSIPYDTLTVEAETVRRSESAPLARDAVVVDQQWRFASDVRGRIDTYRALPVCEFGRLVFEGAGWGLVVMTSDPSAAHRAACALSFLTAPAEAAPRPRRLAPQDSPAEPFRARPSAASASKATASCPVCGAESPETARHCADCGTTLRALEEGHQVVGRYRIDARIGRGAMGSLYKVWDTRLETTWALKELKASGEPVEAAARFRAEARILARLAHPGLPRVVDSFTEGGCHYLVMDYVEGEPLSHVLERSPAGLPEPEVRHVALQVLDILEYLHGQDPPVLYRDLKPSNVMRDPAGRVVLVDFGIARPMLGPDTGTAIGTPGYAPPEQYRGHCEPRSDLYSLAATLHHLATGTEPCVPFQFASVRALRPEATESLDRVLRRALDPDPGQRHPSADAMRRDLGDEAPACASSVLSLESLPHGLDWTADGRLLVAGYDAALWPADLSAAGPQLRFGEALSRAAISPDGSLLAAGDAAGVVRIWHVLSGRRLHRFEAHADQVLAVAFSPDGQLVATASLDGTVRLHDALAGESRGRAEHPVRDLAFTPDGSRLVGAGGAACAWDVVDGWLRADPPRCGEPVCATCVAPSPDGTALVCGTTDGVLVLLDAATLATLHRVEAHAGAVLVVAWTPAGPVSGGTDGLVRLWDASGGPRGVLEGHEGAVCALASSRDGRLLATASWDRTVRIWS